MWATPICGRGYTYSYLVTLPFFSQDRIQTLMELHPDVELEMWACEAPPKAMVRVPEHMSSTSSCRAPAGELDGFVRVHVYIKDLRSDSYIYSPDLEEVS